MIEHGGTQSLMVDGIQIPLQNINGDTLQLAIRRPHQCELDTLQAVVLCSVTPSLIWRKSHLFDNAFRHLNERTINATLATTTQLASSPLEAESRIIPQQHRSQRAPALAVPRPPGRTDTDTFFCAVRSVRGYKVGQLFVHVPLLLGGCLLY